VGRGKKDARVPVCVQGRQGVDSATNLETGFLRLGRDLDFETEGMTYEWRCGEGG